MELHVKKYRNAIDTLLELKVSIEFHAQARKLAPRFTTKLFHLKQETIYREKQEKLYAIINAHEAEGYRITTPTATRVRFNQIAHP